MNRTWRHSRLTATAALLGLLTACAHTRLSTPELESVRGELAHALRETIQLDYPDSQDPEVEILEASETSERDIQVVYRLKYSQEDTQGSAQNQAREKVQTVRTLQARLARITDQSGEGQGYRVTDRKTASQEMEFTSGFTFEQRRK